MRPGRPRLRAIAAWLGVLALSLNALFVPIHLAFDLAHALGHRGTPRQDVRKRRGGDARAARAGSAHWPPSRWRQTRSPRQAASGTGLSGVRVARHARLGLPRRRVPVLSALCTDPVPQSLLLRPPANPIGTPHRLPRPRSAARLSLRFLHCARPHLRAAASCRFQLRSIDMNRNRWGAGALAPAFLFAATSGALAHGFAGDRVLPATILTDDPFVADEMSLPTFTRSPSAADGSQEDRHLDVDLAETSRDHRFRHRYRPRLAPITSRQACRRSPVSTRYTPRRSISSSSMGRTRCSAFSG